jgi:hypothetical protein
MTTVNLVAYCGSDRLTNAWLYLKQGDACTRLRSDADGLLLKTISTDPDPEIASFVEPFVADAPSTLVLGWSRNGLPLPSTVLNLVAAAFTEVELELKPENLAPLPSAPIASHETNTIQAVPMLKVVLPALPVVFEEPAALQLWPMFAEPFAADYATDGLAQGASLWNGDHLTVRDGHAATPASAQKIPKDLGVGIRGIVKNGAKQVDLYLLDAKGERLKFRLKPEPNAPAADVTTSDVKTVDGKNAFALRLFADDPKRFFGLVQLVAVTKQGLPDGWGNVTSMLLGVQLGLCDDHLQSDKGDVPGPPVGPGDEMNVVDFSPLTAAEGTLPVKTKPPQPKLPKKSQIPAIQAQIDAAVSSARATLSPNTRARRMVCFPIRADRKRPSATDPSGPAELWPEMPLWMAELQLVGFRREEGQAFLQMRQSEFGVDSRAVAIQAGFALTLSWRGPDDDLPSMKDGKLRNKYSHVSQTFKGTFRGKKPSQQAAGTAGTPPASSPKVKYDSNAMVLGTIDIEDDGNLKVSSKGASTVEVDPPFAAAPYPLPERRVPALWLDQRLRSWNWTTDGPAVPTLVLEWQPPIVEVKRNDFTEIMLGGDGKLVVEQLNFAGKTVARPSADPTPPSSPPSGSLLALPSFRVKGDSPAKEEVEKLVDTAVENLMATHPDDGPVQMLSEKVWKKLARQLLLHESGCEQFSPHVERAVYRRPVPFQCHGIQSGMPKFGAPAGYGLGQHDPPRSVQDMWNFYEHIRVGIEELIVTHYGKGAYEYLTGLNPSLSSSNRLDKAIFLREMVRGYNGGREFVYEQGHWIMRPWTWVREKGKPPRKVPLGSDSLPYVNNVLGTLHLNYPHTVATAEQIVTLAGPTMEKLL